MATQQKWTQAEVNFAAEVSKQTGADFYTIFGWEMAEGGPPDNPLNIGPGQHFGSVDSAAKATSDLIENSGYYKDILASFQGHYPTEDAAIASQSRAIAYNTHWNVIDPRTHSPAAIANLRKQYLSNISAGALQAMYEGLSAKAKVTPGGDVIPANPTDPFSDPFHINGITDAIGGLAHDIAYPFEWLGSHWDRILLVIGGAILVIIALVLIANSTKNNVMTFKSGGE